MQRKSDLNPTTTQLPLSSLRRRNYEPRASSDPLQLHPLICHACALWYKLIALLSSLLLSTSKTNEYHRIRRYLSVNTIAHHGTERLLQTSTAPRITTTPSINPAIAATATTLAALLRELQPAVSALNSTVLPHESSTTRRSSLAVRSPFRRPCVSGGQTWRTSI